LWWEYFFWFLGYSPVEDWGETDVDQKVGATVSCAAGRERRWETIPSSLFPQSLVPNPSVSVR